MMNKSIKFKNNLFLDSTGIVHNKELLSELLKSDLKSTNGSSYVKKNQNNYVNSLSLGKGTWIVIGEWRFEGFDFSSWTTLINATFAGASSKYDDSGYVNDQVVGILINNNTTPVTIYLNVWPRNKDVTVLSSMCALRLK